MKLQRIVIGLCLVALAISAYALFGVEKRFGSFNSGFNIAAPYVITTSGSGSGAATTSEYFGSLNPNVDALFDVGTSTLRWRNAKFSGTLTMSTVSSTQSFVDTTSTAARFLAGNGILGAPAFAFTSDPATGMYLNGAGNLALKGTSLVQIVANGGTWAWNATQFTPPNNNADDIGSLTTNLRSGFFQTTVSSTEFIAATGTAALPSYTFNGSTGTGMYQQISNLPSVDFSIGGVQGASLQTGGNFSVFGSAANIQCGTANAVCSIGQFGGTSGGTIIGSGNAIKLETWNGAAQQVRMTILGNQSATSVGINNPAPTAMLDVGGTVSSTQFIVATGTVGAPGIVFNSGIGNTGIYQGTASNPNPTMDFALIGADNMTLATGGNLAVIGSSANFQCVTTNATCTLGAIQGQTGITNIQSGTINLVTSNGVAGGFQKRLTILGNQYATSVGINESAPVAMLDVAGQTSSTSFFVDVEGTTSTFRGTSTTQATVGMQANPITDNTVCITAGGVLVQEATNCTVSSIRFKEHVKSLDAKTLLDEVKRLRAVSYDYKPDMGHGTLSTSADQGFIAEEVASIDPYLVVWEEGTPEELALIKGLYPDAVLNGHLIPKTVDYAKISVLLTGAVQAQQDQVTALTSRMDKVEHRVGLLERIVSWLKSLFKK